MNAERFRPIENAKLSEIELRATVGHTPGYRAAHHSTRMRITLQNWLLRTRALGVKPMLASFGFWVLVLTLSSLAPLSAGPALGASPVAPSVGSRDYEIIRLPFNPAIFEISQFVTMRDKELAVIAYRKTLPLDSFSYEFSKKRLIKFQVSQFNHFVRSVESPREPNIESIIPFLGPRPQSFRIGDAKITLFNGVRPHYPAILSFCGGMQGPAENFIRIERGDLISDKVFLYVFPKTIEPVAENRCEDGLYSPPHNKIRIISSNLIALGDYDGTVYLAGQSYVAMPFVIKITPMTDFSKNIGPIYLVDKSVVDHINSTVGVRPGATQGEAAFEIEERLLDVTVRAPK